MESDTEVRGTVTVPFGSMGEPHQMANKEEGTPEKCPPHDFCESSSNTLIPGLEALRAEFPSHDIWFVTVFMGPNSWCAKPKDMRVSTLVRDSPDELRAAIRTELAGLDPERVSKLVSMPGEIHN